MMKTLCIAFAALLVQLPPGRSQTAGSGSIEGIVVDFANEPVAGAQVRAWPEPLPPVFQPDEIPLAISDSGGRFAIENVAPGGYRITVTALGYAYQEYGGEAPGRSSPERGTIITVIAGRPTRNIAVRLTADSIISGRITSVTGEPLVRMQVRAVRRAFNASGTDVLAHESSTETNDRGEYRLAGLPPGRYYVLAESTHPAVIESEVRRMQLFGRLAAVQPTPGHYPLSFYPGVADSADASQVDVREGVESRNIDFALLRPRLYRIRGNVRDPENPELPQCVSTRDGNRRAPDRSRPRCIALAVTRAKVEFLSVFAHSAEANPGDGAFELVDVAPGTYWVTAQAPGPPVTPEQRQLLTAPGSSLWEVLPVPPRGATLVTVIDADVENVEVTIVRNLAVTGRFSIDGQVSASPEAFAGIRPELWGVEPTGRLSGPIGILTMDPDGTYSIRNLPPWGYRVKVSGLPPDLYVKDARFGSSDALSQTIQVTSQPAPSLDILLATGGEITGLLSGAEGPVPNHEVVLVPDRVASRVDLYKTASTDSGGAFTLRGVAPGAYRAFAWEKIERFRYFDPGLIREFEGRGTLLQVREATRVTVDLRLID